MAESFTELGNDALHHLGISKTIADLDTDTTLAGTTLRRFQRKARDSTLRCRDWSFARYFPTLTLVTDTDDDDHVNDEWGYAYRYPSDALCIRKILSGTRMEGKSGRIPFMECRDDSGLLILTDQQEAVAQATYKLEDPTTYPPDFELALSLRWAALISSALIAGDPKKLGERAMRMFAYEFGMAASNSLNEEQLDQDPTDELTAARE